jgi:hypothetical protein
MSSADAPRVGRTFRAEKAHVAHQPIAKTGGKVERITRLTSVQLTPVTMIFWSCMLFAQFGRCNRCVRLDRRGGSESIAS